MGTIDITQPIIIPAIAAALPAAGTSSAASAPKSAASVLPAAHSSAEQTAYNPQAAEQARALAAQQAAQHIADAHVLGDTTFVSFESNGELVTRFTDRQTGKVTYVPQPSLFTLGESSVPMTPLVKIQA